MTKVRKRRRGLRIFLVLIIILLVIIAGALLWYKTSLEPVSKQDETVEIKIEQGETYQTLLKDLEEKGLIKSELAASIYSRLKNESTVFEGTYKLNKSMSTPQILGYLADSENAELSYAVVTIPEGYWAKQIAQTLASSLKTYTADDFLSLWNDESYISELAKTYPFLNPEVLDNNELKVKLEGYLFPETYYFEYDMTPDQITRAFLDQFAKVYNEYKQAIEESPYTLEQILTLASIIQFESGSTQDMEPIAGVLYNRLNAQMRLEVSPSVCYALYDQYDSIEECETNTTIESPYNTYLNEGLPPGPIDNPGKDAIHAALYPQENDYYFFLSDIYGDGKIHYAATYEEHLANMEEFGLNNLSSGSDAAADGYTDSAAAGQQENTTDQTQADLQDEVPVQDQAVTDQSAADQTIADPAAADQTITDQTVVDTYTTDQPAAVPVQ